MELLLGGLVVLAGSVTALAARARRRRIPGEDRTGTAADVRPHDLDGRAGQSTNQWTFGS